MSLSLLITAGSTREPIDSLLFVGHRDTGRWGVDVATCAAATGHRVTLLLAGADLEQPLDNIRVHSCGSSSELRQLVLAHLAGHAVIFLSATIPAWRPVSVEDLTLEAQGSGDAVMVELQRTVDPVHGLITAKRPGQKLIVLRQGICPAGPPASGIDAEIWQNPAPGSTTVQPFWRDAGGHQSPGRIPVDQWAAWVLERLGCRDV